MCSSRRPLHVFFFVGLSYTVSSAGHRSVYQSSEVLLERDTNISRTSLADPSVLNSMHKHFIPSSNQQCQISLEEDVLIEIFSKNRRGKPVTIRSCSIFFRSISFPLGKTLSFLVQYFLSCRT